MRLLLTVEYTFDITGRGVVITPGLKPIGEERFKIGDPLTLKTPDGKVIHTEIGSLQLPNPNPKHKLWIMLTKLKKSDIPIGTEVWSQ
jgi:hypothetical protein